MDRVLVKNVEVDGGWWGPAHGNAETVPDEVADKITNPAAWAPVDAPGPEDAERDALRARATDLGVKRAGTMGVDRLREEIADAEAALAKQQAGAGSGEKTGD